MFEFYLNPEFMTVSIDHWAETLREITSLRHLTLAPEPFPEQRSKEEILRYLRAALPDQERVELMCIKQVR